MKVQMVFDRDGISEKVLNRYLEPLCKKFADASGLDGVNIAAMSGVVVFEGYTHQGEKADCTVGLATIEEYSNDQLDIVNAGLKHGELNKGHTKVDTLVSSIISTIREKLGLPKGPGRRVHLGQIAIPNEWFAAKK